MTSTRLASTLVPRAIRHACVGLRALGVASMAAMQVVDPSRSAGQGPPALR